MKLDKLPESIDPSLDLDVIRRECIAMVKTRAYVSAGVAAIPVPFLDVAVDAGMLSQLLPVISSKFGLAEERMPAFDSETRHIHWKEVRDRGVEFAGLVATRSVVRLSIQNMGTRILTTQVVKFIPLGGQIVAAGMGYYVMRRVALDHINACYDLAKKLQNKNGSTTRVVNGQSKSV